MAVKHAACAAITGLLRSQLTHEEHAVHAIDDALVRTILDVAEANKLLTPIIKALAAQGFAIPHDYLSRIAAYRRKSVNANRSALNTVLQVSGALTDANIEHLVFKGPIRQLALGQDVADRPVADVDVLVKYANFNEATDVIKGLGYWIPAFCDSAWWRYCLGEHPLLTDDRTRKGVDLHHRTQQPSCPRPRRPKALWSDPRWINVAGEHIRTFGATATYLHTVISVIKGLVNREPTGAHVLDLARQLCVASDGDRATFDTAASSQGLSKSVAVAHHLVQLTTGIGSKATTEWLRSDDELRLMLLIPDAASHWPSRRQILWHLVDGETSAAKALAYGREMTWSVIAEAVRRIHDVSGRPVRPQTK